MRAFWSFARAPLTWSLAVLALYAPFALIEPVNQAPPDCYGWAWCDYGYIGLVFDPTPAPGHLLALLIIPSAFMAFLAAHIAGAGASDRAHWFMLGPLAALIICPILLVFFLFVPYVFFVDPAHFPALIVLAIQAGLALAILASPALAYLTLVGALLWHFRPRRRSPRWSGR
jgi:hypothetical protein